MKKTILVDMDGVLVHYDPKIHGKDKDTDFLSLQPIPGALQAIRDLIVMGHEIFIATTAPWDNPQAWTDKRLWIGKHLPELKKRIFMTHYKNMLIGDVLIDDRIANGAGQFKGHHIHFGQSEFPDWDSVMNHFKNQINYKD